MYSKKVISCICATTLLCSAFSPAVSLTLGAEAYSVNEITSNDNSEFFICGEYEYRLTPDGDAVITKYSGTDNIVTVPNTLDGKKVTAVGHVIIDSRYIGAFSENEKIEKVILPDTLTEIESVAFLSCQNLKTVVIPDSVHTIGGGAFAGTALESIEFPKSLEVIPDHCFTGCPFTELDIPDSITTIQGSAFWNCDKLTKVTLPSSLDNLDNNAFDGCTSLKDAYFFGDNTIINSYAFSDREGNHGDVTIHGRLGSSAETFANENGFRFVALDAVFGDFKYSVNDNGEVTITEYNGTDKKVTVPDEIDGKKVTSIGFGAFAKTNSIEKVILPNSLKVIDMIAFFDCTNLKKINLPESLTEIKPGAFAGCAFEDLSLPSSINTISAHCFAGNIFTKFEISNSIQVVGERSFWNCENLSEITLPDSVESVEESAFAGCTSLNSITFENAKTIIDPSAFTDNDGSKLKDLTVYGKKGSTAEKIANDYGYKFVSTPYVYGDFEYDITEQNEIVITKYNGNDKEVNIPSEIDGKKVSVVGCKPSDETMQGAFKGNMSIQKVTIPDGVTMIEGLTFLDCENLKEADIPDTVSVIGAGAFANCSLETLKLPSGLTEISAHGFAQNKIKDVVIPESVASIKDHAFWQCESLKAVTIPKAVNDIEEGAFEGCTLLSDITFENPNTIIDKNTFTDREGNSIDVTIHGYTNSTAQVFASDYCFKFVPIDGTPLPPPNDVVTEGDFDFIPFDDVLILIGYNGNDKDVNIPDEVNGKKVRTIGEESFKDNENTENVTIPETIIHISPNSFYGCKALKSISIPKNVEDIGSGAFAGCTSLTDFTVTNPETSIDPKAFTNSNGTKLTDITIHGKKGSTAEKIADEYGFRFVPTDSQDIMVSGDYVYTVNDDNTVTIYKYNGSETEVAIPSEIDGKKVTVIGSVVGENIMQGAFSGNKSIKKVIIPNGVIEIQSVAFYDCENLTAAVIPDTVTKIGGGAFAATALESIALPKNLEVIPDHGFAGCKFQAIEIPDGVHKIESSAFWQCEELTEIVFPESLEEIDENAFDGCTSLKDATFKNPNTKIDKNAFADREGNSIDVTIHGLDGSTAKDFAEKNSLKYEQIGAESKGIYGDVDNDGHLTSYDSLLILRQSVGLENFTTEQIKIADVDNDGTITSNDSLVVLRASVGLYDSGSIAGQEITK